MKYLPARDWQTTLLKKEKTQKKKGREPGGLQNIEYGK